MNDYRQLATTHAAELDELLLISQQRLILLMFTADWCMPCRLFATRLQQIQRDNVNTVQCMKIDLVTNASLASQWQIMSLPTLCWLYKGQLQQRTIGLLPIATLQTRIDHCLAHK